MDPQLANIVLVGSSRSQPRLNDTMNQHNRTIGYYCFVAQQLLPALRIFVAILFVT